MLQRIVHQVRENLCENTGIAVDLQIVGAVEQETMRRFLKLWRERQQNLGEIRFDKELTFFFRNLIGRHMAETARQISRAFGVPQDQPAGIPGQLQITIQIGTPDRAPLQNGKHLPAFIIQTGRRSQDNPQRRADFVRNAARKLAQCGQLRRP